MVRHIIDHSTVVQQFENHLSLEDNKRILFSAPFGAGKSTFLNNYFSTHDSDKITLKLYPVNYSVAANEDVFELIKYDLLAELLGKYGDKLNIQEEDFSPLLIAQSYLINDLNINPLSKALLKFLVPKGDEILQGVEAVKKIYESFISYKSKIKSDDTLLLKNYITWCETRKGFIYEKDEVTALIGDLIQRLKQVEEKQIILIIDDLDRLDPEHIFRLFNIFSAHYDPVSDENKFGFDKVIFVCDFTNINLIYIHRYGENVDFKGYIDKFYSVSPFLFDNRLHLKEEIRKVLATKHRTKKDILKEESTVYKIFIDLLLALIDIKALTLRDLERIKAIDLPTNYISAGHLLEKRDYEAAIFEFLVVVHLLNKVFTLKQLKSVIKSLQAKNVNSTGEQIRFGSFKSAIHLIDYSLPFILPEDLAFKGGFGTDTESNITVNSVLYKVGLSYERGRPCAWTNLKLNENQILNVYDFFMDALIQCEKRGFID